MDDEPLGDSASDESTGFAPSDLTDGRAQGDWESRYVEKSARRGIRLEAGFLAALLAGIPILLVVVWHGSLRADLGMTQRDYSAFATFAEAWLAGALGGAVFSMKWLYHMVGHGRWHVDRRLWRLFTPIVSGSLAFALIALATSGLFDVLDADKLRNPSAIVGAGFLLGYFSDNTVGKLAEIAERLVGRRKAR